MLSKPLFYLQMIAHTHYSKAENPFTDAKGKGGTFSGAKSRTRMSHKGYLFAWTMISQVLFTTPRSNLSALKSKAGETDSNENVKPEMFDG